MSPLSPWNQGRIFAEEADRPESDFFMKLTVVVTVDLESPSPVGVGVAVDDGDRSDVDGRSVLGDSDDNGDKNLATKAEVDAFLLGRDGQSSCLHSVTIRPEDRNALDHVKQWLCKVALHGLFNTDAGVLHAKAFEEKYAPRVPGAYSGEGVCEAIASGLTFNGEAFVTNEDWPHWKYMEENSLVDCNCSGRGDCRICRANARLSSLVKQEKRALAAAAYPSPELPSSPQASEKPSDFLRHYGSLALAGSPEPDQQLVAPVKGYFRRGAKTSAQETTSRIFHNLAGTGKERKQGTAAGKVSSKPSAGKNEKRKPVRKAHNSDAGDDEGSEPIFVRGQKRKRSRKQEDEDQADESEEDYQPRAGPAKKRKQAPPASTKAPTKRSRKEQDESEEDESENDESEDDYKPRARPVKRRKQLLTAPTRAQSSAQAASSAPRQGRAGPWTDDEKAHIMEVVMDHLSADRASTPRLYDSHLWEFVSRELKRRFNMDRPANGCKMYWCREGRRTTGADERDATKKRNKDLQTSVQ